MFESAETKEQWLTDLKCALEDIKNEIKTNPFGANPDEIANITSTLATD
jgi:hypothetical protein